jgi:hypothetical protein
VRTDKWPVLDLGIRSKVTKREEFTLVVTVRGVGYRFDPIGFVEA